MSLRSRIGNEETVELVRKEGYKAIPFTVDMSSRYVFSCAVTLYPTLFFFSFFLSFLSVHGLWYGGFWKLWGGGVGPRGAPKPNQN